MLELSAILAALAGGLLWLLRGAWKENAKTEAENETMKDERERTKRGENAAAQERKETTGISDSDVADRVRRRSSRWRRM